MNDRTESEKVFEEYLNASGFASRWTHEPSIQGKARKPDYLLKWVGRECFFEVKELRKKPSEPATWPAHIDPYSSLRAEIDEARKKFKEFKEYSCSLVVYNIDDAQARLDPDHVLGAMLGDLGLAASYNPDKGQVVEDSVRNAFLGGGKMIDYKGRRRQNTTVSAIVVLERFLDNIELEKALRKEEANRGDGLTGPESLALRASLYGDYAVRRVPRVIVVENPFARIAFPPGLFRGSFDERWRWKETKNGKVERAFMGDRLRELEALRRSRLGNSAS